MGINVRIKWIDIAKTLAIIAVIVGHVVNYNSDLRNLIFSFHMPLFFILTGYTMKADINSPFDLKKTKKDFFGLIIPAIVTQFISFLLNIIVYDSGPLIEFEKLTTKLFWASAIKTDNGPALGALWFLVVMFWAKQLYYLINNIFRGSHTIIVYLGMLILGKLFLNRQMFLPQSFDVVPFALFFLKVGNQLKEIDNAAVKKTPKSLNIYIILLFVLWIWCWQNNIYINMGSRRYPEFILCICAAVSASVCIIAVAKTIESSSALFSNVLSWWGKETLIVLCIHHLDSWYSFLWYDKIMLVMIVKRILIDFLFAYIFIRLKKYVTGTEFANR